MAPSCAISGCGLTDNRPRQGEFLSSSGLPGEYERRIKHGNGRDTSPSLSPLLLLLYLLLVLLL